MRCSLLLRASAVALVMIFASGCAHAHPGQPLRVQSLAGLPRPSSSRVLVLVMENAESVDVLGNPAAPFLNSLVGAYGLATQSYAITHPSLPNYLALTSGSTDGISSDCTDCHVHAQNIVDQLEGARMSWKAYLEEAPS
ncbi:MAG: alkaline phosphatase family protein, partial [Actinomycetota bacterium]|nr:alkaline phosphatase family protein [Actinomycetota bacterium]